MQFHGAWVSMAQVNRGKFGKVGREKKDLSLSRKDNCVSNIQKAKYWSSSGSLPFLEMRLIKDKPLTIKGQFWDINTWFSEKYVKKPTAYIQKC